MTEGIRVTFYAGMLLFVALAAECFGQSSESEQWKSFDRTNLASLSEDLSSTIYLSSKDTSELTRFFIERYPEPPNRSDTDLSYWLDSVGILGPKFSEGNRQKIAQTIKSRVLQNRPSLVGFEADLCVKICRALSVLGLNEEATALAIDWIVGSQEYREIFYPGLAQLAEVLNGTGESGREARSLLLDRVNKEMLVSAEKVKAVSPRYWWQLAFLGKDLKDQAMQLLL